VTGNLGNRLSFGDFVLDTGREQLFRGGREVPLTPKAFGTLRLLLVRCPNVVDKDTIASEVWDSPVSDAALTMVMAELRKALGDSASQPAFIRTVHKRGYAFCAEVRRETAAGEPGHHLMADGKRISLPAGEHVIGRDPSCSIHFPEPSVSWHHARLLVNGGVTIEDLGSTNGTFVNAKRATGRVVLKPGDRLELGKVSIEFDPSPTRGSGTERIPGR